MSFKKAHTSRKRVSISFLDDDGNPAVGRCKQAHKAECDMNNIIRKHDKTGLVTHVNTATQQYGDFTEVNEYQVNLNMIMEAREAFAELPSEVRKRFGNDPGQFFEYATNPDNLDGMIDLGLAIAPTPDEPLRVVFDQPQVDDLGTPKEA